MGSRPRLSAQPPTPPPPPSLVDQTILEARLSERRKQSRKSGYAGTILGSPQGVTTTPTLGYPTLLGGGVAK